MLTVSRYCRVFLLACAFVSMLLADDAPALREVRGQTLISRKLPAAELTVSEEFRYLGGQRANLYGNADAEQHLFVKAGQSGPVERFLWVQFEHFFPTNTYTYNYPAEHTTNLGGIDFVYDSKSVDDWATQVSEDPASDGAAIAKLLSNRNLSFPKQVARIRMFHLPTPDRRTELMIIYGEAISPASGIPLSRNGISLDKDAPDAARRLMEDLRKDLTIRTN